MKKRPPFDFILDALDPLELHIKPMFGAYGVYLDEKILFILYKKEGAKEDSGIWLGIPNEFILEFKNRFPSLKDLTLFGKPPTAWQVLRETDPDFEELAIKMAELIKKRDPQIGRIPKAKVKTKTKKPKKK